MRSLFTCFQERSCTLAVQMMLLCLLLNFGLQLSLAKGMKEKCHVPGNFELCDKSALGGQTCQLKNKSKVGGMRPRLNLQLAGYEY